ncbi:hypothetical protein [Amycolatopsis sp. NBC_01480]|uniref:hypothetical protein n=1 Tax=Amycolatopsis sp. NBC_01480 TaxID=2903562 RepID=UPI002E2A8C5B|nr:hypothetical protein [Amycolatopsis sp. NBC_01480]
MASAGGGAGRRRRRRSSAEVAKLEALRQAHVERLAQARDNERRVKEALGPFAAAAAGVEAAHEHRAERHAKVDERLVRRLEELDRARAAALVEAEGARAEAAASSAAEVEEWRAMMGEAVRTIRDAGVELDGTAELLGISAREVNALARLRPPESPPDSSPPRDGGDGEPAARDAGSVSDDVPGSRADVAPGWPPDGTGMA